MRVSLQTHVEHPSQVASDEATRPRTATRDPTGWSWAGLAAATWFAFGYARYRNLHAGASDLGIFDQASWLLAHGKAPFITSIGVNVFADHVSPVIVLFAPLYRIIATPVWLLAVQAACLGITVLPMRRLADELHAPRWLATVGVVLSAPLLSAALYDVHPVVFATPAIAWLVLAARRDDRASATIAAIVIVLCRADAATAILGAAVIALPATRRRLLWLWPLPLVASIVVPRALGSWQTFDRYYHHLGTNWGDFAMHPWRLGGALVASTSLHQLLIWLLPVGFLPLLRLRWLVALVVTGFPLLVSTWPGIPVPWYHHHAFLVPFAVGGALAAWSGPSLWSAGAVDTSAIRIAASSRRGIVGAMGAGIGLALAFQSPVAIGAPAPVRLATALHPAPAGVAAAIAAVGPREGVSSTNEVLGHLSQRVDAYLWPCPFANVSTANRCGHSNLVSRTRADRVDVVVLPGYRDVSALRVYGFTRFIHRDGFTEARR